MLFFVIAGKDGRDGVNGDLHNFTNIIILLYKYRLYLPTLSESNQISSEINSKVISKATINLSMLSPSVKEKLNQIFVLNHMLKNNFSGIVCPV